MVRLRLLLLEIGKDDLKTCLLDLRCLADYLEYFCVSIP